MTENLRFFRDMLFFSQLFGIWSKSPKEKLTPKEQRLLDHWRHIRAELEKK